MIAFDFSRDKKCLPASKILPAKAKTHTNRKVATVEEDVMSRTIGVTHRTKRTAEGEPRPTLVAIASAGNVHNLELETEDDELAFIRTLEPEDRLAMIFGGSGDRFAAAANRFGETVGAKVYRIPAFVVSKKRNGGSSDADHLLLTKLFQAEPSGFYEFRASDRNLVLATELFNVLMETKQARIACEQRIKARLTGIKFCSPEGGYPEGKIEDLFDAEKANNVILQKLIQEEKARGRELEKAVCDLAVYRDVLAQVTGCGPRIAGGIIGAIKDIRRFETESKFVAFCGMHVAPDGKFVRRRVGSTSNWNSSARQALYLLAEQFNRRPDSVWGQKLRENKLQIRARHPEIVIVDGKKRYTDGHIHKMAVWRTLTRFTRWLYREWWKLENPTT